MALLMAPFPPEAHSVHVEVHDGSGVEREHLTKNQSAHDRDAERTPEFGTDATAQRQRQRAEQGGHSRHQNRAKAEQTGLKDCVLRTLPFISFGGERKIDHQNRVFLHDSNQQDDPDQRDNAEVQSKKHQSQHSTNARRTESWK